MADNEPFQFEFSLENLNNLGRGLYRSFATVIAEAISNSWDAEATEVLVTLQDGKLIIEDNGKGMNDNDFRYKFLKVGYSRRKDPENKSKRIVIGRKGIGKLAMLSISKKVAILSRKKGEETTGGIIDNTLLDNEIEKDGKYELGKLSGNDLKAFRKQYGTKIIFEELKTRQNKEDIIRKYIATQFNFMFSIKKNDKFEIKVNGTKISPKDLEELNGNTQFVWFLGKEDKKRKSLYKNLARHKTINDTSFKFGEETIEIKGFIASVKHPRHLLLRGSSEEFKASINLFCNGRLRQENLFEEITSKMVAEEYLYGEVHVDGLEDEKIDRFTSSMEGIIKDDPLYQEFLRQLRKVQSVIMNDWTPWRNDENDEGDIDMDKRPAYEVRMENSRNRRIKDFRDKINDTITNQKIKRSLQEKLKELSYKNTLVYQDLFILENMFREFIRINQINESDLKKGVSDEEDEIVDTIDSIRNLRKQAEERHALKGKIVKKEHYLNYLLLFHLGEIIDLKILKSHETKKRFRKGMELDTKEIEPIRNPIMHTNEITEEVFNWEKIKNVIDYIERLKDKAQKKSK